jgi:hypothetical protein
MSLFEAVVQSRLSVLNSIDLYTAEDVMYYIKPNSNGAISIALIPIIDLKNKADKNILRNRIFQSIRDKSILPELQHSGEAFYCSYDFIYDVDYCYHIDYKNEYAHLHIYTVKGGVVYSNEYNPQFDESNFLYSQTILSKKITEPPKIEEWSNLGVLYHLTHSNNLQNIIDRGLCSHIISHSLGLLSVDISNKQVNDRRKLIHNCVPLYFNIKNPMTYSLKGNQELVILQISKSIMLEDGIRFTDGNAASGRSNFYSDLAGLRNLDWECIRAEYWHDKLDGKRKRCAEVLVPYKISVSYVQKVSCQTSEVYERISPLLRSVGIPADINPIMFF